MATAYKGFDALLNARAVRISFRVKKIDVI
jgi:hypothetical protein